MKKAKKESQNGLLLYLLAIILALLVYSFLMIRFNPTGKVIHEIQNSYTLQQIQEKDDAGNCWVTNNNNVYDITGLIDNKYFKESDCGKEIYLNDYFIELLRDRKVGIRA